MAQSITRPAPNALASALRLLARRELTRAELMRRLQQRGFEGHAIDEALAACEQSGYLNDLRAAEARLTALQRRGWGARRLALELQRMGLAQADAERLAHQAQEGGAEQARARAALSRKAAALMRESDPQRRQARAWRFLLGRGFSAEVVAAVLREKLFPE